MKLYRERFNDLSNKKMVLQKAIFTLEDNSHNQSMRKTLKDLNTFTNNNKMSTFINLEKEKKIIQFNLLLEI